jgi:hypothetical protein
MGRLLDELRYVCVLVYAGSKADRVLGRRFRIPVLRYFQRPHTVNSPNTHLIDASEVVNTSGRDTSND